jgi:hypothetical protein
MSTPRKTKPTHEARLLAAFRRLPPPTRLLSLRRHS